MATETVTRPRVALPGAGDDDPDHLWCCDENVSMCGLDISALEVVYDEDEPLCPLCAYVDEEGLPCPVPGCNGGRITTTPPAG